MPSYMCIKHCYACWNLGFLPDSVVRELAIEMERLRIDLNDTLLALRAIFTPREAYWARPQRPRDARPETLQLLFQFRKVAHNSRCCRGYWCLDYAAHFHEHGCFTVGGLHSFLLKRGARNVAHTLDESRRKIETAFLRQRFANPFRLLTEAVKSARSREQGRDRHLLVVADASVEEDEVALLRELSMKMSNCLVAPVAWFMEDVNVEIIAREVESTVQGGIADVVLVRQNPLLFPLEEEPNPDDPGPQLVRDVARCRALIDVQKVAREQPVAAGNVVAHCSSPSGRSSSCCLQEALLRFAYMAQHDIPFVEPPAPGD